MLLPLAVSCLETSCCGEQKEIFQYWRPNQEYRIQKEVSHRIMLDLFATSLGEKPIGKLAWGISDVSNHPAPYTLNPGFSTNEGLEQELQAGPAESGERELKILKEDSVCLAAASCTALC